MRAPLSIPLPLVAAALFAMSCGDEFGLMGQPLDADPSYFASQRFFCPPSGPSCPPFVCSVDELGAVHSCDPRCAADPSTAFESPDGFSLCVPERCVVEEEGAAPICEPRCADDGITYYEFHFSC